MNKKIFIFFNFIFVSSIYADEIKDSFVVVLMVKNEEPVINKTLEPFIKENLNSFLIFDTGSTDKTVQTVKDYFIKNNVKNWHVLEEPFIDFATSRNRALDLAEEKFTEAKFFLMPDAEWYMHNVKDLINFCRTELNETCNGYLVRIMNQNIDFTTARLIRAHVKARFAGVVHEVVIANNYKKVPAAIYFELGSSRLGFEKSQQRWKRDEKLLFKSYEENPNDPRTAFYLAQTYECLGDFDKAYKYYEIRSKLKSTNLEEDFETSYRLGRVIDILSKNNKNFTWHMALDYYFNAHNLLPHRAEPLVKIADHYWPDGGAPVNTALCYLFAKRACELIYPENDLLFIDPEAYNFRRYELLSKSAWQLGDYVFGEAATRKALAAKELPYLLRNLACYVEANKKS